MKRLSAQLVRITLVALLLAGASLALAQDGDSEISQTTATQVILFDALEGHTDGVGSVAFSPDSLTLISGSDDQTVRVWSLQDMQADPLVLDDHTDAVLSVAYSPDGATFASASKDQTAKLWDAADPTAAPRTLEHDAAVNVVIFTPDSTQVITGAQDGTLTVWDVASGERLHRIETEDAIRALAFNADGTLFASGDSAGTLKLWDAATFEMRATAQEHNGTLWGVAFSPDGSTLVSAGADKMIRVWAQIDGAATPQVFLELGEHTEAVMQVAFSPNGRVLASVSQDQTMRLWDTRWSSSNSQLAVLDEQHKAAVNGLAFSPDGRLLASSGWDHVINVWRTLEPPTQEEITTLLEENFAAIMDEDIERYMATLHPGAAEYATARELALSLFAQYDLDLTLKSAQLVGQDGQSVYVRVEQISRDQAGSSGFSDNAQITMHTLRRHEGEWRIYATSSVAVEYYE